MLPKLLEMGEPSEPDILRRRVEQLEAENEKLLAQLREVTRQNDVVNRSVSIIRKQLNPLYLALRGLFGEINTVFGTEEIAPSSSTPQANAKWDSWKRKLGGKQAEFIDALLEHGEMTGAQFKVACRCAQQTVYDTIAKLNKAQLLNKNGGKYSLKEL